jgi:two-component system alkaline phosphatase synthesis response regulator PhoP
MAGNKKVLIVDDEPDILKTTIFRVKSAGYEAISAENGQEGLDKAHDEKPDLILLDWKLPVITGSEVYKKLKEDEETKEIPIIFFTASTETDAVKKMYEMGAKNVITKPYEPEELLAMIAKLIR